MRFGCVMPAGWLARPAGATTPVPTWDDCTEKSVVSPRMYTHPVHDPPCVFLAYYTQEIEALWRGRDLRVTIDWIERSVFAS